MKAKVDAIAAHGINVFVNRQLIYNYPESLLAEKGIMVIEHADFEGIERLSLVTGGEIASTSTVEALAVRVCHPGGSRPHDFFQLERPSELR